MEKLILSNGREYELIPNGVNTGGKNEVYFMVYPGNETIESIFNAFKGNDLFTVKIDETTIREFKGYSVCDTIQIIDNYFVDVKYFCPECHVEVEADATNCPSCNAAFEAPEMEEIRATVCKLTCHIPDINGRMSNAEDAIEDIISTILG